MTAVPQSGSFVMVPVEDVAALGPVAAIVLARIVWRSERDGVWTATRQTIATETGLPLRSVRAALDLLRERSMVAAEQGRGYDRTATWRPVYAGQAQGADPVTCMGSDSSHGSDGIARFDVTESATSSLETVETLETPPLGPPTVDPSADADQAPVLFLTAVPDLPDYEAEFTGFWDLWPSGRKVGKPKALLAYRAARKRGASIEQIAAGLHAHLPGWTARIAAGESGFVPHPTTWLNRDGWNDPPPIQSRGRRMSNAFADPSLGGPTPEDMARFSAMMNADRPLALGGGQ